MRNPRLQFVWTLKTEAGMYFCFERLLTRIGRQRVSPVSNARKLPGVLIASEHPPPIDESNESAPLLSVRISFFLSLFRQFLPDLWSYFDEEGVDVRELASAWLAWFFAKEMPIDILMRLWGTATSLAPLWLGGPH